MSDLGTLGGTCSRSWAAAINDKGQVVGTSSTYLRCSYHDESHRPVIWYGGRIRSLARRDAGAVAINDAGDVLIDSGTSAFIWTKNRLVVLSVPGGRNWTPTGLNDAGEVVGYSESRSLLGWHALLWKRGRTRDLGSLPRWRASEAVAINDEGVVVGNAYPSYDAKLDERGRAVVWHGAAIRDLGTLGGKSSAAAAISGGGAIVGWAELPNGDRHAALWRDGRTIDLGSLPGRRDSAAVAINSRGVVIGNASATVEAREGYVSRERAFVWEHGGLIDLGVLPGGAESGAIAINEHDQIVGWSTTRSGRTHAVLWTLRRGG